MSSVSRCRPNRLIRQEHIIKTYEVTDRDGLPVAFLREERIKPNKNSRCIAVLRTAVGIGGAGIGATIGMVAGPLILVHGLQYLGFKEPKPGEHEWVLYAVGSSFIIGMGTGAITGRKITTCVFNLIFGKEN